METSASGSAAVSHGNVDDRDYDVFLERLNARFLERTNDGKRPLFKTDAADLFTAYLNMFLTPEARQYHNCHSCRRFLELYGGLVIVDDEGRTRSAMWDESDAPAEMAGAIGKLDQIVRRARITTVFLTNEKVWGQPITGPWKHMAITATPTGKSTHMRTLWRGVDTAEQIMAEKREDFRNVSRALAEFSLDSLEQVVQLLRSDQLYRSDKVLGPAEWLCDLQRRRTNARGSARENVTWLAVATAPAGFCHPRSSMIGTLLADIESGLSFHEVAARFHEKMAPTQYQRPQAAPKAGSIARAERLAEGLGIGPSLRRRYLTLAEVADQNVLWRPAPPAEAKPAGGFFGHLKARSEQRRAAQQLVTPPITMTWAKFQRDVLDTVEALELRAPHRGPYCAFVTAVDVDAPPILQWDRPDARNPVSWYFEDKGAFATRFGLSQGLLCKVTAVLLKPTMWQPGFDHFGKGVMFVLDGARDREHTGLALFPEILKSELHEARAVIEAHSKSQQMEGVEQSDVAGLMLEAGGNWGGLPIRAHVGGRHQDYLLDRWD